MKKKLLFISYYIVIFNIVLSQSISANDLLEKGKKIFLEEGNCATCHTLKDANSKGNIGPNLNEIKPDIVRVLTAVKNGIGVMPAYEGILSNDEIKAVASYVAENTN